MSHKTKDCEFGVKEAARRLGVTEDEVLLSIQTGQLEAENISMGTTPLYRITSAALEHFASSRAPK
ncbi:MAG: hypothetical protein DME22_05505 [Verrucomicrobia bacterium]|nr:MAG: hypothetical protein DME22_05505 [Verrucomicrobiota bacterium]PYK00145.1 MAG: hypothetical protein DME23_08070 [Verrucomicrobiota bacterium]